MRGVGFAYPNNSMKFIKVLAASMGTLLLLTACSGNPIADRANSAYYDTKKVTDELGGAQLVFFEENQDEFGSYTRTFVELPKDFTLADGTPLTEEALSVLNTAVKFTSLEAIDSIALDTPARWEEWKTNVAPQYLHSQYLGDIYAETDEGETIAPGGSGIIFRDTSSQMPRLIRDGGVRIADKRFSNITVDTEDGVTYYVSMSGSALIYSTDDVAAPWRNAETRRTSTEGEFYKEDGTLMTKEEREAEYDAAVEAMGDQLADAYKDDKVNASLLYFNADYSMMKDGDVWKITSFSNTYTHNPADIQSNNGEQLNYRNNIKK